MGVAWGMIASPMIFRSLIEQGYRDHLPLMALVHSIAVSAVVLLIFLLLRKAMMGSGMGSGAPPPPADVPAAPAKFTDLREILAYVLAHAAGIAWAFTVNPMIFRSLVAQGHGNLIWLISIAIIIAVSIVVLLIFLFLRKAMAGPGKPA